MTASFPFSRRGGNEELLYSPRRYNNLKYPPFKLTSRPHQMSPNQYRKSIFQTTPKATCQRTISSLHLALKMKYRILIRIALKAILSCKGASLRQFEMLTGLVFQINRS